MRLPFRRKPRRPSDGLSYQVVEVIGSSAQSLDEAVAATAERIAERTRTRRSWPRFDIVGLAMLAAAGAGAFAAARALLDRETEKLPVPDTLQNAAAVLQDELRHAREAMQAGIVEGRRATAQAMRDLEADYLARVGRGSAPDARGAPAPADVLSPEERIRDRITDGGG